MFNFDRTDVTFDSVAFRFTGIGGTGSFPVTASARVVRECVDYTDMTEQALALLPRGRAWQADDGGPRPGTALYGFWKSIADLAQFANARLCALQNEFFCATHEETRAEWLAEYGLPDECDPFPDLCAKVAATGGADCASYKAVAAAAGWDIDCYEDQRECGARADCIQADDPDAFAAASPMPAVITIRVYRETSPAYSGPLRGSAYADCMVADGFLDCPPDISGLICILNRIVHAHVRIDYVIGDPRTTLTDAPISASSGISTTGEA